MPQPERAEHGEAAERAVTPSLRRERRDGEHNTKKWLMSYQQMVCTHLWNACSQMTVAWNISADEGTFRHIAESKSSRKRMYMCRSCYKWLLCSAGNLMFSAKHVPELHLVTQAKRHYAQLPHTITYWEASEAGEHLLLPVFCSPNVRTLTTVEISNSCGRLE